MIKQIKVTGLNELQAKCDWDVLVQPEMDDAIETIVTRVKRGGKGLGVQRNNLTASTQPLSARVETTLNYPRTRGTAWGRKNEAIVKAMGPRVAAKAVKRIGERWGSESGGDAA